MKASLYFRVLIASLLVRAPLVQAEIACSTLVTPIFGNQIQVMDRRAYEEIRNHPISQLALDLKAKGLVPAFWFDQEELFDLPPSLLGESIQTKMLVRILKAIFPEAKINQPAQNGLEVKINILDSAEAYRGEPLPKRVNPPFEMALLKAANPMKNAIGKNFAREKIGIAPSKRVMSFYADVVNLGKLPDLLNSIPADSAPDVILISKSTIGSGIETSNALQKLDRMFPKNSVLKLSEGPLQVLHSNKRPTLIYNDTTGRMPEIYAASDYAVVMAPNNIFEPITSGIPVLFFSGKEVILDYDPKVFGKMAKIAEASGGGVDAIQVDLAHIQSGFEKLFSLDLKKAIAPPFVIPKGEKKTAFSELLDQIQIKIESAGKASD